jgi:hypothetical protein
MSAELVPDPDPNDPAAILRDLPARERDQFLSQYHDAVEAAHNLASYHRLQHLLHAWRLTAIAASQPGYYEEIDAVRAGTARTLPADAVVPDWPERLAAARTQAR